MEITVLGGSVFDGIQQFPHQHYGSAQGQGHRLLLAPVESPGAASVVQQGS